MPKVRANCTKTGIITTTSGVLFMMALASATNSRLPPMARAGLLRACRSAICVMACNAPVRTNAPTMMNIAAIVQGAGFDRAATASA